MKQIKYILWVLGLLLLVSCEEDISLEIPDGQELLVVEGHIEQDTPPILILTRSIPVLTAVSNQNLEKAFVHDAQVTVTSNGKAYTLKELPSASFSDDLKQLVAIQFGIPMALLNGSSGFPFYVYTSDDLKGEVGKSYGLRISYEGRVLTSNTTIPNLNPINQLWTMPHPDPEQDSLKILFYKYIDPDTVGNSIRYFTKRNQEPFYPGLFGSVFNDEVINGGTITFPLDRGEPKGQKEVNRDLYGYFGKGDTVTVRWAAIDLAHYRFWNSLEREQNSNGSPIGSPNTTRSNINGGLGIWGGYGVTYHKIIIK